MVELPRLPGLRPGSAADFSGTEHRFNTPSHPKSQELRRLRRQQLARSLHQLGARAVFEIIDDRPSPRHRR
jgi:hypothetical protein